jgi:hypothetical protein
MFGRLTRKTRFLSSPLRHARLQLEHLENRDAPTALSMNVSYGINKNVNLSGQLTDVANPGGQTITFTGKVTGTTTTNADGTYLMTAQATGLGTVTATVPGATATVTLTSTAPQMVDLDAVESSGHWWEIYGDVSYWNSFSDVTVNFGGAPVSLQGKSTNVQANGHFDYWIQLNGTGTDNGTMTATPVDCWGLQGNAMLDLIYQTGT